MDGLPGAGDAPEPPAVPPAARPADDGSGAPDPGPLPAERHPDDLPPDPGARRGIPPGLLWAAALFVVVLAIASFVALSNDGGKSTADGVVHLDPNAPVVPDTVSNGLSGVDMVGRPAPTTSFETFTGSQASLADLAGKPVVVNFWSSSCTGCVAEMPDVEKLHQRYGDKVAFVGINTVDGPTPAAALAKQTGVTYELGRDPNGSIAKSFGVVNLPTTVLVGRDGTIVYSTFVTQTADSLAGLIDQHLRP
jgi:thiol-disulfide isomerase/thioredoxin